MQHRGRLQQHRPRGADPARGVMATNTPGVLDDSDRGLHLGADPGHRPPGGRVRRPRCGPASGRAGTSSSSSAWTCTTRPSASWAMGRIGRAVARRALRLRHDGAVPRPHARSTPEPERDCNAAHRRAWTSCWRAPTSSPSTCPIRRRPTT
ncbi:MAG: hypothetical protein MZW92_51205 [Comamonadaceae bacterium]|nr:hypothetical protein [Comamonadaceae bacterium]